MKLKQSNEIIQFKHIEPSPVKDANFEIRIDSKEPIEFIYAHLYNSLLAENNSTTGNHTQIMNIPLDVRLNDRNLSNFPWYEINFRGYIIKISPIFINVNKTEQYEGWDKYFSVISTVFSIITQYKNGALLDNVSRIGLRYSSIYENLNIVDKINLNIKINEENLFEEQDSATTITHKFRSDNIGVILQIIDKINAQLNQKIYTGSLLDIDTYQDIILDKSNLLPTIEKMHDIQKRVLGTILKDEYINECNNK